MRLVDQQRVRWKSRAHFFAISAQIMRRILVDHARRRGAGKRRAQVMAVSLDEALGVAVEHDVDLVCLDEALDALAELDVRQSRIIEVRYFGGLTIAETAEVLKISPATVKLDWAMARAWLFDQLERK